MFFRLCINGRAILESRELVILEDNLVLSISDNNGTYTAIIKNGDRTFYRPFNEGIAELEKKFISPGVIATIIIKNNETKPTYICDELYAEVKGGCVAVAGNMLEYDKLLTALRCENDDLRREVKELSARLDLLQNHYDKIYAGHTQL